MRGRGGAGNIASCAYVFDVPEDFLSMKGENLTT